MPRTSTSFTKETAPKGKGGHKHDSTKIKEAIGLDGWENLCTFIKTEGAVKLQQEMLNLKGKDFVMAYTQLIEFVKPKLQRTTLTGDPDSPLTVPMVVKVYAEGAPKLASSEDAIS